MRTIKHTLSAIALACGATGAYAQGIPTFDLANLLQAALQTASWGEQYSQMLTQLDNQIRQIKHAQAHLDSMNGVRNLGQVANRIGVTDLVPADMLQQLQSLQSSAALVNQVKTLTSNGLSMSEARGQQIQQLMAAINTTTDPKSVAEIQARISAEGAAVTNDANRIAILDVQQRVESERINLDIKAKHDAMVTSSHRVKVDFSDVVTLGPKK
jgi:type IV secretion system protein VirB5